jgi:hypothetical protein
MKTKVIIGAVLLSMFAISCRKEVVCVCTDIHTGARSYGDPLRSGPIARKAYTEGCEAGTIIAASDSVTCAVE